MNKKYDNKKNGRGHGGRSGRWSYGDQKDDQKNKDEFEVVVRTREIKEEEGKELEEEAFVEIISTIMKKGLKHLNVLSAKEGMIEGMNGRVKLQLLMKIQGHRFLKMLKEEKL